MKIAEIIGERTGPRGMKYRAVIIGFDDDPSLGVEIQTYYWDRDKQSFEDGEWRSRPSVDYFLDLDEAREFGERKLDEIWGFMY